MNKLPSAVPSQPRSKRERAIVRERISPSPRIEEEEEPDEGPAEPPFGLYCEARKVLPDLLDALDAAEERAQRAAARARAACERVDEAAMRDALAAWPACDACGRVATKRAVSCTTGQEYLVCDEHAFGRCAYSDVPRAPLVRRLQAMVKGAGDGGR